MYKFTNTPKEQNENIQYKINIKIMTFILVIVVVIMTLMYFVRIYSNQKDVLIKDMLVEANLLSSLITDNLNHSRYFVKIISSNIKNKYPNLDKISTILKSYYQSKRFNRAFGWRKYSWVDHNHQELITSSEGIIENPRTIEYLKNIIDNNIKQKSYSKLTQETKDFKLEKLNFYISDNANKAPSLKLIDDIFIDKKYIGSVVLSYDIETMMIQLLNDRKKKTTTNFLVLDGNLNIIAKSKEVIDGIIDEKNNFSVALQNTINNYIIKQKQNNFLFLNTITGRNFFITTLDDLPFFVVINVDDQYIKDNITSITISKFIEVAFLALISLALIVIVYNRENKLRSKSEKASRKAQLASDSKTKFLAFTAHEIRSPLSFIVTSSEIMKNEIMGKIPDKYKEYIDGIHNNANLILNFIKDILDENQILAGKLKMHNRLGDLENLIDKAIELVNSKYYNSEKKIHITKNIEDELPLLVCDHIRIVQIINNLLNNAVKYSKHDAKININAKVKNKNLLLEIQDEGIGMDNKDIPIALSPYGRIDKDNNRLGSYGLGLPIVKMLVEAHDAKLQIISKKNKGTTVKIIFPNYKLTFDNDE